MHVRLNPHPGNRAGGVRGVTTRIAIPAQGDVAFAFAIEGDLRRLCVPDPRPPGTGQRLWEHTCCEIFVAARGRPAYHEFNLSPSGEWAVYAFSRYRERRATDSDAAPAPRIALRRAADTLVLDTSLDLASLPYEGSLVIGLSVVIEEAPGRLGYWALRHPPGGPDFHHPSNFAVALDEVRD